jgi:hypothetical protein
VFACRSSLFAKLLNKQLFGEFVRQMDPGIKVAPDAYEQLNEGYGTTHPFCPHTRVGLIIVT